jgi:hypothetical protein
LWRPMIYIGFTPRSIPEKLSNHRDSPRPDKVNQFMGRFRPGKTHLNRAAVYTKSCFDKALLSAAEGHKPNGILNAQMWFL